MFKLNSTRFGSILVESTLIYSILIKISVDAYSCQWTFLSFSNLARDCIPIDQVDRLPLNISFKQISMTKLRHYLWRSDFDAYFKHPNQTGEEEFVREKLVENDFPVGYIEWIYLSHLIFGILLLIIALGFLKFAFLYYG